MLDTNESATVAPATSTGRAFSRALGDLAKVTAVAVAVNGALLGVLWQYLG